MVTTDIKFSRCSSSGESSHFYLRLTLPLLNLLQLVKRFDNWRTQLQPIRTFGEITAHIKILPVHQPYLYQKLSQKATKLRLLGMPYEQIAKSLNIDRKTATKACKYEGR